MWPPLGTLLYNDANRASPKDESKWGLRVCCHASEVRHSVYWFIMRYIAGQRLRSTLPSSRLACYYSDLPELHEHSQYTWRQADNQNHWVTTAYRSVKLLPPPRKLSYPAFVCLFVCSSVCLSVCLLATSQ